METTLSDEYTYKFVRVVLKGGSWNGKFSGDYQDVISDHGRKGWRFVQAFAPSVVGYGASKYIDLIFEKRMS